MSIEQTSVIDFISVAGETGNVCLTVSDHLPWNGDHLLMLQNKLNAYLRFLESGEIYQTYPSARGREFEIRVVTLHRPNELAHAFLKRVGPVVANAGCTLTFGPGPEGYVEDDA